MAKNSDISFSFDRYEVEEFQAMAGDLPTDLCNAVDIVNCLGMLRDMREQLAKWEAEIKTTINYQVNGL